MPESAVYVAMIRPFLEWSPSVRIVLPHMNKTCTDLGLSSCKEHAIPQIYFSHMSAAFKHFGTIHILDLSDISECTRTLRRLTGFRFNKTVLRQHINAKITRYAHTHEFKT